MHLRRDPTLIGLTHRAFTGPRRVKLKVLLPIAINTHNRTLPSLGKHKKELCRPVMTRQQTGHFRIAQFQTVLFQADNWSTSLRSVQARAVVLTKVPIDGLAPFSSLVPYRVRLVSNSCSVAVGVGSLQQRASLAYSAKVPPAHQHENFFHFLMQLGMHLGQTLQVQTYHLHISMHLSVVLLRSPACI